MALDITELLSSVRSLSDLDKVVILNPAGRPVIGISWTVLMFFNGGETIDRRLQANKVLRDFLNTFGSNITHYHPPDASRLRKIDGRDIGAISDEDARAKCAASGRNDNDSFSVDVYGFIGGKDAMVPPEFYFGSVCSHRDRPLTSYIEIRFPLTWDNAVFEAIAGLFARWCRMLSPMHATLSPGLNFTDSGGRGDSIYGFPLLQRFPGLDDVKGSRWTAQSQSQQRTIRTTGWITAIDEEFVQSLGGLAQIKEGLSADIPISAFAGNVLIQAGPKPLLGDRNRGDFPELYAKVARLLQPLVFTGYNLGLLDVPAPWDGMVETRKWLNRFTGYHEE